MRGIRGVIYDCDGVLFDSHRANLAYYNKVLGKFGEPEVSGKEPEKMHLCHTASTPVVLKELICPTQFEEAMTYAAALDYREFIPFMTPEKDMVESLQTISQNLPLAVATNRGYSMMTVLEQFGLKEYFSSVVTSKDVPRPKPYPDMLFKAMEALGCSSSEVIFVGDSVLDQKAAEDANVRFVSYKWGDYNNSNAEQVRIDGHAELVLLLLGDDISASV